MQNQFEGQRRYLLALMANHSDADVSKIHFRSDCDSTMIALIAAINIGYVECDYSLYSISIILDLPMSDVECAARLHSILMEYNWYNYATMYRAMEEDLEAKSARHEN